MTSPARVAAAMRHAPTSVADETARETGIVRRRRVLTGAPFVQALVLARAR